jgi:hypothetical protein
MNATDTRWLEAAERQMPTLWDKHNSTVRQYLHHSGGGCMNLQRTLDDVTGAHICLTQDGDTFYVWVYSDDGERCEGHEINVTDSDSNAVWWFLNGTTPADPCPCVADNA